MVLICMCIVLLNVIVLILSLFSLMKFMCDVFCMWLFGSRVCGCIMCEICLCVLLRLWDLNSWCVCSVSGLNDVGDMGFSFGRVMCVLI